MADEVGTSVAFATVFRRPALRRVQLAWAASHLAHVSIAVALAIYAYRRGGAAEVSLLYVLRLVPAAIATPFAAVLGDRFSRASVMLASNASRFVMAAAIPAAVVAGESRWLVYALSIGVAVAGTPFRPAQVAILPSLVERPEELTAANVVASTIEGLGFFAGPAIAGILLAATGTTAVFTFVAVAFGLSTVLLLRPLPGLKVDRAESEGSNESLAEAVLAGARTIARSLDRRGARRQTSHGPGSARCGRLAGHAGGDGDHAVSPSSARLVSAGSTPQSGVEKALLGTLRRRDQVGGARRRSMAALFWPEPCSGRSPLPLA